MWSPGSVDSVFSQVCVRYGLSATPRMRCSARIGRVDGFTCHSNVPEARDLHPRVEHVEEADLRRPGWPARSRPRRESRRRSTSCARSRSRSRTPCAGAAGRRAGPSPRSRECLDGVGGVLHREEERLAVALAGVGAGAHVLADRLLERRVELVEPDLERVAEAAGGVVAPVLGRRRSCRRGRRSTGWCSRSAATCGRRAPCRSPSSGVGP